MSAALTVVVPTLGAETLADALAALRADAPASRIRVVWQGDAGPPAHAADVEWIRVAQPLGFAAAANLGAAGVTTPFLGLVNDDALVEPGWSAALIAALGARPGVAAAQGRNLRSDTGAVDGEGLAWNRDWQAVQIGHGAAAPARAAEPREVFGVSATAAVYRRDALAALGVRDASTFDQRLGSFYEDVDLAVRLRRDGWSAVSVPSAAVRHRGSFTTSRRPLARWRQIHGNRWLVLARLLGSALPAARAVALRRDLRDAAGALRRGDLRRGIGVLTGWARAARRWRHFAHDYPPLVAPELLARFGAPPLQGFS